MIINKIKILKLFQKRGFVLKWIEDLLDDVIKLRQVKSQIEKCLNNNEYGDIKPGSGLVKTCSLYQ
jgi:hypothetical protein